MAHPASAKFAIGELVHHKLFDYRGVVYDIDPEYSGSEAWYKRMVRTGAPRNRPWYHVLVHRERYTTYVAEQNLEKDTRSDPIDHPGVDKVFDGMKNGVYVRRGRIQ